MNEKEMNEFVDGMVMFVMSDKCSFPEFSSVFKESVLEIKSMFNDEKSCKITQAIQDSVNIIEELYMEFPLNQENIDFLLKHLLLLHNMNTNFIKDDNLSKRLSFLDRCLSNLLTSIDAVSVMRSMIFKMRQYSKYGMPSIELSKLYVESME